MRYPAGHKEQTRAKIVRAAGKVFRREGYHAAGVDKVMEEAGLTAGGFYAHFKSKEALLAETLAPAASEAAVRRERSSRGPRAPRGPRLSWSLPEPVAHPQGRGRLPAAGPGLRGRGRAAGQGELRGDRPRPGRCAATAGRRGTDGGPRPGDRRAVRGRSRVARSVQDEALADRILAACRDLAKLELASEARVTARPARNGNGPEKESLLPGGPTRIHAKAKSPVEGKARYPPDTIGRRTGEGPGPCSGRRSRSCS